MAEFPVEFPIDFGGEGGTSLYGFEAAYFTGDDPELAQNRLRTVEFGPIYRDVMVGLSAKETALTIRGAVRAIYQDGSRSPWRITNTDVVPANTSPVHQAVTDATNALTLAGSKTKVFYQTTPPTSGMKDGDVWFDTTEFLDVPDINGVQTTKKRYTPYRYNVSLWEPADDTRLLIASEIAAGAIAVEHLATDTLNAVRAYVQTLIAADIEAGNIVAGAVASGLFRTAIYTEDANGNPTQGAKMFNGPNQETLKIAPQSLHIGSHRNGSFGFVVVAARIQIGGGALTWNGGLSAQWGVSGAPTIETINGYKQIVVPVDQEYNVYRDGKVTFPWANVWVGFDPWPTRRYITSCFYNGASILISMYDAEAQMWGDPSAMTGGVDVMMAAML